MTIFLMADWSSDFRLDILCSPFIEKKNSIAPAVCKYLLTLHDSCSKGTQHLMVKERLTLCRTHGDSQVEDMEEKNVY